jgi:hypothetical protein
MGIFLVSLGCVMVGALVGAFCMALCVAAQRNQRLWAEEGEEPEAFVSDDLGSVIGDFTAFDVQDSGITRFTYDVRHKDFINQFGRIPLGSTVSLSIRKVLSSDKSVDRIFREETEKKTRDFLAEAPHA